MDSIKISVIYLNAYVILRGQQLTSDNETIYDHVITNYPNATQVVIKIMEYLDKTYHIKITNKE